jgi:oxidase EvaA
MNIKEFKSRSGTLKSWLKKNRTHSDLKASSISLKECREWDLKKGHIQHSSGRFFSIVGLQVNSNQIDLASIEQPIINQPEIGILGFLVKKVDNEWHWLLQAKAEPGNVNGVQAAPTVQATKSNYEMVHNGLPTPFLECFTEPKVHQAILETDIEQSEQGDRFLNKYNRNCVSIDEHQSKTPPDSVYKWFSSAELRSSLLENYAINTDARSVILCSDWNKLSDHGMEPFARWKDQNDFAMYLFDSLHSGNNLYEWNEVLQRVHERRSRVELETILVPLDNLKNWSFHDHRVLKEIHDSHSFQVQFYHVQVQKREVKRWCQPLLRNLKKTNIYLICTKISGTLYFFFRLAIEPGFKNKVQLAPSIIDDPHHQKVQWCFEALSHPKTINHASVLQSDEGGRFMKSIAQYCITEVDSDFVNLNSNEGVWLSLHQVKKFTQIKGYLTNESRSALSILLSWA